MDTSYNGLTEPQNAALAITEMFLGKLSRNGVEPEQAIYEAYKFCDAALRGDSEVCARMDAAAAIVGRAALNVGIHPDQRKR